MMDNRVFNVNGCGETMLRDALRLAFVQEGFEGRPVSAKCWTVLPNKGLVLLWHIPDNPKRSNVFPVPLSADDVSPLVFKWLQSEEAQSIKLKGWDAPCNGDASNEAGWRVFVGDWGHVEDETYAICAVTPSCLWLGK